MAVQFSLQDLWDDQTTFNRLLRPDPRRYEERTALTKEFTIHMVSEIDELLRACGAWKPHRNLPVAENRAAVNNELADIFKLWMSVCQVWGITPEEALKQVWVKSMVVRQRHAEEWVKTLDKPSVVVDIDNVLADYVLGFVQWATATGKMADDVGKELLTNRPYIDAERMGVSRETWKKIQHEHRVSGAWAHLPVMPDAPRFLQWCRDRGFQIILLTSRRITDYPNIQNETVQWLHDYELPYDFLWWAQEKSRAVMSRMNPDFVRFVVDDDITFIRQFEETPIRAYWLAGRADEQRVMTPYKVRSLVELMQAEVIRGGL